MYEGEQSQQSSVCSLSEATETSKYTSLTFAEKQRFFDEIAIIFLENDLNDDGFLSRQEFESIQVSYMHNAEQDDKDELFNMYKRSPEAQIEINRASSRQIWSQC